MYKVDPVTLLESLRWKSGQCVTNPFGDRVWLKPLYKDGKRVGITDCCLGGDPCKNHQKGAEDV